MLLLRATFALFRDAAIDAARAAGRSAFALVLLLLLFPVLAFVGMATSPLGMVGGFVVGLMNAACAGTYLATLQDALDARRTISISSIQANLGRYTSEVLGVAFPIWVVSAIASFALPGPMVLLLQLAIGVALNVAPEMIGRTRSSGVQLLQDAFIWLKESGVEWFAAQAAVLVPLLLWRPSAFGGVVGMFGPNFGFVNAGSLALSGGSGPLAWAGGLAMVAFVHAIMLFRGALFQRLGQGGRRARVWRARMGS
jgi:hypothetical protein